MSTDLDAVTTDPVAGLAERLVAQGYVADRPLAMVLHLASQGSGRRLQRL